MTREYLLKVIEKHFWVLSKEEIAAQIHETKTSLPPFLVEKLQAKMPELDSEEKRKIFHPYFCDVIEEIRQKIASEEHENLTILGREKLFDDCLMLISIYYHYSAVLLPNVMADFLRVVLMKKILLT
ncbi:MAG: hypothetical protein IJ099_03245 [Alphaproteobacteria bacterium]|nr:hypothetical protein [Alphaproteobacteria bacterium]